MTALVRGKKATPADLQLAQKIFNRVGKTVVVKENLLDAVTAVSGSGPAYVFLFAECLTAAARELGLDKTLAQELVEATLLGSSHQMIRLGEEPAALRAKVTSKGGTTQAAIAVFEKRRLAKIFVEALTAAKLRAAELARR
jgi:pyrroline-5-carboxylate reductase